MTEPTDYERGLRDGAEIQRKHGGEPSIAVLLAVPFFGLLCFALGGLTVILQGCAP